MILSVAFLDVYHGDCAVITFHEGGRKACIVVDGGEKKDAAKRLATYLKHEKVEVIDLLVATHIDQDHIYGLLHFLKKQSNKADSWNRGQNKCIHHYWGPKPDPNWNPLPKKKRLRFLSVPIPEPQITEFVIQSVKQNQKLNKLIRERIFNVDNIRYPSLQDLPPFDIFQNVELKVMAPDVQILDSEIQAKALTISNLPHRQALSTTTTQPRKRLTLEDLHTILATNADEMAKIADRHANNQSIVFKLTPTKGNTVVSKDWSFLFSGDAEYESWEMMRQITEIRKNLPSKVLKVPHHGSINGIDEESFKVINPEFSIISVGQKHGLPDHQTLNLIKVDMQRKLFCTERNNSKSKPGPCAGRKCVREKATDFRSIRFTIDTDTEEIKIDVFTINTKRRGIEIKTDKIWCPENKWPNI